MATWGISNKVSLGQRHLCACQPGTEVQMNQRAGSPASSPSSRRGAACNSEDNFPDRFFLLSPGQHNFFLSCSHFPSPSPRNFLPPLLPLPEQILSDKCTCSLAHTSPVFSGDRPQHWLRLWEVGCGAWGQSSQAGPCGCPAVSRVCAGRVLK